MQSQESARLSIVISENTNRALRAYLGSQGQKKGDLSRFVEEAVRWRMLDNTVQAVRARAADIPYEDLQAMIDEAVDEVRKERPLGTR